MRKAIGYLAFCAFALALAGCSLPAVSGTMTFADGSKAADYSVKAVEASTFNEATLAAMRTPDGKVTTKVMPGTSVASAVSQMATGVAQGLSFWVPFCAAGNC